MLVYLRVPRLVIISLPYIIRKVCFSIDFLSTSIEVFVDHIKSHSDIRDEICSDCVADFVTRETRRRHQRPCNGIRKRRACRRH